MPLKIVKPLTVDHGVDFRARAAFGVALTALGLLLPFALVSFWAGQCAYSIGILGIVAMLGINVLSVIKQQDHQTLTLFGLVPAGMVFMTQVFLHDGFIGSLWCFPSILACYCMLSESRARAANGIILVIALPMAFHTLDAYLAARVAATLMAVSLFASIVVRVIDEQQTLLRQQVRRDPLTGLLNRVTLQETLERQIDRGCSCPAVLLALDLDHFKRINDTYGHETGDAVLCSISAILLEELPCEAFVFRQGGEEFLVVLPDNTRARAARIAEGLRCQIGQAPLLQYDPITVSIGVAPMRPSDDWMSWMRAADAQLYAAKRQGRNRVVVAREVADDVTPPVAPVSSLNY